MRILDGVVRLVWRIMIEIVGSIPSYFRKKVIALILFVIAGLFALSVGVLFLMKLLESNLYPRWGDVYIWTVGIFVVVLTILGLLINRSGFSWRRIILRAVSNFSTG